MILGHVAKQPREVRKFKIGYSNWLDEGETLSSVSSEVDVTTGTSPMTVDNLIIDPSDEASVYFYIKDGDDGVTYKTTFLVTTTDDRTIEDEVIVRVEEI